MNSNLLDLYCKNMYGHTDWEIRWEDGNAIVTFFKEPREGYEFDIDEQEDDYAD